MRNGAAFPLGALLALAGCASLNEPGPYAGRAMADVVRELGPPDSIADYQSGGRYFSWSTSDVRIVSEEADNPANWREPMTRTNAPQTLDEEKLISLPDYIVSPEFRPSICTLTLVAEWDAGRSAWIARRAIRGGPGPGGRCGMRVVAE